MRIPSIFLTFFCFLFFENSLHAQATLNGKIQDKNNIPLGFAAIFVQGTSKGTTSNVEGAYTLNVPVGTYQVTFQYIGYKSKTVTVNIIAPSTKLDVVLESEATELPTINLSQEDPAYNIIRKAQAKRKYYLEEEIQGYRCKSYTKIFEEAEQTGGTINLFGATRNIEKGIFYLSETVSEISFSQPDNLQEKVLASKISGDSVGFSYNRANWINFYRNKPFTVNNLKFVSPIAQDAMDYYRYALESTTKEDELTIHKIEISPKFKNMPAFKGFIYIIEETARIHSVEAYVPKGVVMAFDSINIRQIYTPVTENRKGVWFSLSLTFYFELSIGKTKGFYHALTSDYEINPTFPPNFFGGKVYEFVEQANKKEEQAWEALRPIPLTNTEIEDYKFKTVLENRTTKPEVQDSILKVRNKIKVTDVLLSGITLQNPFSKKSWSIAPLLEIVNFNTVEGLVINPTFSFQKTFAGKKTLTIAPTFRYGFSNQRFQAQGLVSYNYNPKKFGLIAVEGGRYVAQFATPPSIRPVLNTFYSLFGKENWMKIYEKTFVKINHQYELFNGFLFTVSGEYAKRNPLENTSNATFNKDKNKAYTPNNPGTATFIERPDIFDKHEALLVDAQIQFTPKQKYLLRPDEKILQASRLPTFTLRYSKGMADANFDILRLQIRDSWDWGIFGDGDLTIESGSFLNNKKVYFADFQHFRGNRTLVRQNGNNAFQLLDYYQYSQTGNYFQAHWNHDFKGFITNKLPFLKKAQTSFALGANYLYTDLTGNYIELGIGIKRLFKFLRIDWWNAFGENGHINQGIKLGAGF